jgi:hypothetical protein
MPMDRAVMDRFYPGRPSAMVKIDHPCELVSVCRNAHQTGTQDLNLLVLPANGGFLEQDGMQQRTMHHQFPVVTDQPELAELV